MPCVNFRSFIHSYCTCLSVSITSSKKNLRLCICLSILTSTEAYPAYLLPVHLPTPDNIYDVQFKLTFQSCKLHLSRCGYILCPPPPFFFFFQSLGESVGDLLMIMKGSGSRRIRLSWLVGCQLKIVQTV